MKASLLCTLLARLALSGADEVCRPDQACPVQGAALLQSKELRRRVLTELTESAEELGTRTEVYGGATIIVHRDADTVDEGGKMFRWVIELPDGCSGDELKQLTQNMPKLKFSGDPGNGGICTFIMDGTEDDVKQFIDTRTWPSKPIVETDKTWSAIPEKDVKKGAALLQEGLGQPASWGLDRIDDRDTMDQDYSPPNQGSGVHVYVADTGIRTTHQDFGGRAIPTLEVLSSTRVVCSATDTNCAADRQGHGSHCAATVGGTQYGVAKLATLHAVKVLSDSGSGSFSWFIEALDWVLTSGVSPKVFSASLGGPGAYTSVSSAITAAVNGGVTVVVAAGNENDDACNYSPAFTPTAITVAATQQQNDNRAYYSNFGTCIDIFAPGSSITSVGISNDLASDTMSGTSMACPHVAGAAALLLAEDSSRSPAQVLQVMLARATAGRVSDPRPGTDNFLLYTGLDTPVPTPAPPPTAAPTPAPPPPPVAFPFSCGFETALANDLYCGVIYQDQADDFDWTKTSSATPSSGTGPGNPAGGSYYMYAETSSPRSPGDTAVLKTAPLLTGGQVTIRMKYHMLGADVGSLEVLMEGDGTPPVQIWSKTGAQGPDWAEMAVTVSANIGSAFSIKAVRGNGWAGDIAIDDFEVATPVPPTQPPAPTLPPTPSTFPPLPPTPG
eukprot:CAMPEP_0204527446 /NCGR_PEP_ID=MMETSP0661-20131031/8986_1 /ASSEMBLY_ACC=CAM_ASM_000606 /TAXON_ID=109239 /ORGANISM="Alexandrium margalefi, Strain AMGDE01CS-322" /LENGTH=670 /DNA_ID=CAMNT_0051533355 /DNA_START=83 /DNA_END=2091 /DNA_ORIENTATION=-